MVNISTTVLNLQRCRLHLQVVDKHFNDYDIKGIVIGRDGCWWV